MTIGPDYYSSQRSLKVQDHIAQIDSALTSRLCGDNTFATLTTVRVSNNDDLSQQDIAYVVGEYIKSGWKDVLHQPCEDKINIIEYEFYT